MERIAMSQEERDWLGWLKRAKDGTVTQKVAAEKMEDGTLGESVAGRDEDKGRRGGGSRTARRESNRRIDDEVRAQSMKILKLPDWHDFGPTFASQQLAKRHQIAVSKETVRKWMIAEDCGRARQPK